MEVLPVGMLGDDKVNWSSEKRGAQPTLISMAIAAARSPRETIALWAPGPVNVLLKSLIG